MYLPSAYLRLPDFEFSILTKSRDFSFFCSSPSVQFGLTKWSLVLLTRNSLLAFSDYDGQWKMAHYFAARFFADPMLSFIEEEANFISIYAISDSLTAIPGVQLVVRLWTWSNFTALKQWTTTVDVVRPKYYYFNCVCMNACTYVCTYVFVYLCMYVGRYACMHAFFICMCVCCMRESVYACKWLMFVGPTQVRMCLYV